VEKEVDFAHRHSGRLGVVEPASTRTLWRGGVTPGRRKTEGVHAGDAEHHEVGGSQIIKRRKNRNAADHHAGEKVRECGRRTKSKKSGGFGSGGGGKECNRCAEKNARLADNIVTSSISERQN